MIENPHRIVVDDFYLRDIRNTTEALSRLYVSQLKSFNEAKEGNPSMKFIYRSELDTTYQVGRILEDCFRTISTENKVTALADSNTSKQDVVFRFFEAPRIDSKGRAFRTLLSSKAEGRPFELAFFIMNAINALSIHQSEIVFDPELENPDQVRSEFRKSILSQRVFNTPFEDEDNITDLYLEI